MTDIENASATIIPEVTQTETAEESHNDEIKEAAVEDEIGLTNEPTKTVEDVAKDGSNNKSGASNGTKKSLLVYINALSRIVMAAFLTAGGLYAIPDFFLETPSSDFKYCALFFIIGTGLFLIVALLDLMGTLGNGVIPMVNSSLYVVGAATLEAGSIAFYPGLNESGEPLGQLLYVAGTCVICFALLWDIARLLRSGNVIPVPFIVALFAALVGAINFNYGANFLMPQYQTSYDAVAKGGRFFVVGGACFMIHALAVVKAYLL